MAREIERKFLVTGDGWREGVTKSTPIRQFYLARTDAATVRVRLKGKDAAVMTVKGNEPGMARDEWEWSIPPEEARQMEALSAGHPIVKTRHLVPQGELTWEIDVFEAPRALTLAEIELPTEETAFDRPDWLGDEVTGDPAYYNAAMALG